MFAAALGLALNSRWLPTTGGSIPRSRVVTLPNVATFKVRDSSAYRRLF